MSLLSRIFGAGATGREVPSSVREIATRLDGIPPERAHFLAAFAYVLARVAHADMQVDEVEIAAMEQGIATLSELDPDEAPLVIEIALSKAEELGGTDNYRVTREFRKLSERAERVRLMRCLFAVAAADDSIGSAESSEIQAIGEELGFVRSEVNSLRLEWRDKLAELRRLEIEN
jgi:uncharacterized tellurite resistance protein B-like protein